MKIIPTEARATITAYREGRALGQFLDDMWERRAAEHPPAKRIKHRRMKFPLGDKARNIRPIKLVRK